MFLSCHSWMELVGDGEANWFVRNNNQKQLGKRCLCAVSIYFFLQVVFEKIGGMLAMCLYIFAKERTALQRSGFINCIFGSWEFYKKGIVVGPLIFKQRHKKKVTSYKLLKLGFPFKQIVVRNHQNEYSNCNGRKTE